MDTRPTLDLTLPAEEFRRWYWLKEELVAFCRQQHLPAAGAKDDIAERIAQFLATGALPPSAATSYQRASRTPTTLTAETLIWPGFRCGQQARAFFVATIGPRFHFDQQMRDFVRDNPGRTLQDAIDAWHAAQTNPQQTTIAPQFEYNRHIREFFAQHPGATRAEAIAAWRTKRDTRRAALPTEYLGR